VVDEEWEIEEFDEEVEVAEKMGSYETWVKLEDIYKIHTYRDALKAKFAVVLYPGSRSKMYLARIDKEKTRNQDFVNLPVRKRILMELVLNLVEGVGYLSFAPER